MSRRWTPLPLLLAAACGTQYSDPILEGSAPSLDRCAAWTTEAECRADTTNGCSFQPNDIGCHASDPTCAAGICRSGDPFVRRSGETLWLRGAPYRFVGTVSWGIAWAEDDCHVYSLPSQAEALARTFDDLVDMRADVLKIWAFQSFAGPSGADYSSFDRVVAAARRAGVRLIFVLENHWADCTLGGVRNDAWYASGFQAPYGGAALSYHDYVVGLVEHFRDEPTLLAWELVHEAHGETFGALDTFAASMAAAVSGADPNHLIALGLDNGDSSATSRSGDPSNYLRLHQHPAIDLVDVHDFDTGSVALPPALAEVRAIARALQRPIFAGASAVELTSASADALRVRADIVEDKLLAAQAAGFVGFLVYDYVPDWDTPGRPFDARPGEPLAGPNGVIARHRRLAP